MDEHMQGLLALYALGGLTEDEQQEVEAYLARHPEAEAELREMQLAVTALAHTAPPVSPSPGMEEALMARVTADAQARFGAAWQPGRQPVEPLALRKVSWAERLRGFLSPPVWGTAVAVALLTLVFAALLWQNRATQYEQQITSQAANIQALQAENNVLQQTNQELATAVTTADRENARLQTQLETLRQERDTAQMQAALLADEKAVLAEDTAVLISQNEALSEQLVALEALAAMLQVDLDAANEVLALFASPDVDLVSLPGTENQPQAVGQLLFDPNTNLSLLLVDGMENLAPGQVYQVLLIREDGHDTAETFAVDVQGQRALIVHSLTPMHTFTAVGVSIEPEGGSPQRTGDIILLGELMGS
ncbi:MAG TPA: anti-sigma factor [Chloroflexota bacterium]|nr:anti-sigma factor [Chloroflexota bacterium]HUM69338.1 anti-sigma factor [Chloroflexota bacterium]